MTIENGAAIDAQSQEKDRVGLCFRCAQARVVQSDRGTVFYRCLRSKTDSRFPPYPRLPVLHCAGYEEQGPGRDDPRDS
ncbi:MAG TPA: hypothetical protein VKM93_13975 [Terriglobia bacterium]|nr:hypothetical protein [Terriglobia bacterium]